jgi:hypothetical protein
MFKKFRTHALVMIALLSACGGASEVEVVRLTPTSRSERPLLDLSNPTVVYEIDSRSRVDTDQLLVDTRDGHRMTLRAWLARDSAGIGAEVLRSGGVLRVAGDKAAFDAYVAARASEPAIGTSGEALMACWGDDSCNTMFSSGACSGSAVCYESGSGSTYTVVCACW